MKEKRATGREFERESDEHTQEVDPRRVESQAGDEAVRLYDLEPSNESNYSLLHSNHITKGHLPWLSAIFPVIFAIFVNIQTPAVRTGLLFGTTLGYLLCLVITKNETIRAVRIIKLFLLAFIYIVIALVGLLAATGYRGGVDFKTIDAMIIIFVLAGLTITLVCFILNVYKSEAYREYQIARKNEEIM
jgi:hypothetical protein